MAKPKLALIQDAQGNKFYSVLPSSGVGDFDFSRSGGATRINSQGLIETVADGVSRLNYPLIDGKVVGCPSHLLEDESRNLITYSEDLSNSSWGKSQSSVTLSNITSPDGTQNAYKLTENTATSKHQLFTSISSYTELTISFFAKKDERSFIAVEKSSWGNTVFDLNIGSVVSGTGNVIDFGNGWFKCSATYTASSAQTQFYILLMQDSNTVSYQGDGSSGLHLWGFQAEATSYSTSYIPNYGTALGVTRSSETATNSGDASTFNDSEGVLMAEISAFADGDTDRYIAISDGTSSNRIRMGYTTPSKRFRVIVVSGGTLTVDINNTNTQLLDSTINSKFAFKYKQNDFAIWINGFEVDTDTLGVTPIGLSELAFDNGVGGGDFYGNTKQIQYFDTTDIDLEKLTSWVSFTDMAEGQLYSVE